MYLVVVMFLDFVCPPWTEYRFEISLHSFSPYIYLIDQILLNFKTIDIGVNTIIIKIIVWNARVYLVYIVFIFKNLGLNIELKQHISLVYYYTW